VRAIRAALDELEVAQIALVGKTRPECLTKELARELRKLGVIRLYVGVENASEPGAAHLARSLQTRHIRTALDACHEAGIFTCYNLLVFEPGTTVADVKVNAAFMREHATHPINFCRAEAYTGTPLHHSLSVKGALTGSWLGWNYRPAGRPRRAALPHLRRGVPRAQLRPDGVANRHMGIGYAGGILEAFYPEDATRTRLVRRSQESPRSIVLETSGFLDEAIALAEGARPRRARTPSSADRAARPAHLAGRPAVAGRDGRAARGDGGVRQGRGARAGDEEAAPAGARQTRGAGRDPGDERFQRLRVLLRRHGSH